MECLDEEFIEHSGIWRDVVWFCGKYDRGQRNKLNWVWKRWQGVQENNHQSGYNDIQTVNREGGIGMRGKQERGGYHCRRTLGWMGKKNTSAYII